MKAKTKYICKMCAASIILAALFGIFTMTAHAEEFSGDVPEEVVEISEELGNTYNICPEVIQAICWKESRFKADVESGGCVGIMQVSPKWHKDRMERLGVTDLKDIRQNMTVAVDYLSELVKDGEDMEEALMRYHGESKIEERLKSGEISEYVKSIFEISCMLEEKKDENTY